MKQPQKMPAMTRLFSPAVLALALFGWGSTALATVGTPIVSVPIGLEGDPGSVKFNTKTDANGNYSFSGLPPGRYKLNVPGQQPQTIIIGKDGMLKGQVQKPMDKGSSAPTKANIGDVNTSLGQVSTTK